MPTFSFSSPHAKGSVSPLGLGKSTKAGRLYMASLLHNVNVDSIVAVKRGKVHA
jgi:hypothetical protein